MATIAQQPNETNSAYVPNVWTLDGLGTADRFVLEVEINGSVVSTIKQPANPAGVAHFDVQKILQSYLEPTFVETTEKATDTDGIYLSYQVRALTETGTELNEDDAITSGTKYVINAYDNWRVLNSDFSDFIPEPGSITCPNTNINARYTSQYNFLTNYPETTYKVRSDEYKTLSFFSRVEVGGTNFGPNEAPFFVKITTPAETFIYPLTDPNGSSLRTDCTDMTVSFTDDNSITTIGVGPKNIDDLLLYSPASYDIEVYSYNNCESAAISDCEDISELADYLGDVIFSASFEVVDDCTPFEPVTVSFINQYGAKDYFTFDRRNTRVVNTNRNEYNKATGTWSASSFSIDQQGRGRTVFSSYADTQMTLQSNWMTDEMSTWLEELYVSPSVMAYIDGQWEPVVISSRTYEEKSYARNRMFQHELTIDFANNKKIQRG